MATDRKAILNVSTSNSDSARDARFLEESELVTRAQAGDRQAFGALIGPYIRQAYYVARKITGNREDAEDAAQQSFLKAFARIQQFQREAHFSSWLFRIAINEALMRVRKRRAESSLVSMEAVTFGEQPAMEFEASGDTFHPDILYAQAETRKILEQAIDDLRSTSRAVVWLMGLYERPTKDAAKILSMSESAVKTRFLRARRQLRARLSPYFPERTRKALSPV